jgi:arylsulfatase A-like enzyme
VVGHGGTAADLRIEGAPREFLNSRDRWPWVMALADAGFYTVSVSPFAERHGAWWFYHGFREMTNPGKRGGERADEVMPYALDWLQRNGRRDDWFLHVNFWDPHTPYRTPEAYGNPFSDDPPPEWLTEEIRREHWESYGPMSAQEVGNKGWRRGPGRPRFPRLPDQIASLADFRTWIDGYDVGIRYADEHAGRLLAELERQGVLDDTIIMISSDHGENQGELNVYGDHQTADHITNRVPLVVRWPGVTEPGVDRALHYQMDWAATMLELLDVDVPPLWDGASFARSFRRGEEEGRQSLVVSQCAWSCQRSVRVGPWLMMRTFHPGLKDLPPVMLFNLDEDPHETKDLAQDRPEVVNDCLKRLEHWQAEMMLTSLGDTDPMWTVVREGGPYHTRGHIRRYARRLQETGRGHHAAMLLAEYEARPSHHEL